MTEPRADAPTRQTFYVVWAVVATLLGLVSTGLVVFLFFKLRARGSGSLQHVGWSRWDVSAGGNGHWYKAVALTNDVTWTEADRLARMEGGYLATITSAAENDFVFSLVNAREFFSADNGDGPALGGFQRDGSPEPDGGWGWVSGEPWSYQNWFRKEPNNGRSQFGTEDRVQFYSGIPGTPAATWNDVNRHDLNSSIAYVVERNN